MLGKPSPSMWISSSRRPFSVVASGNVIAGSASAEARN